MKKKLESPNYLVCCGTRGIEDKKETVCEKSKDPLWICSECCMEWSKKWYRYGYERAKARYKRETKC